MSMTYTPEVTDTAAAAHIREVRVRRLWQNEGGHCVSYLVSTLAEGQGGIGYAPNMRSLETLCQQAAELTYPIDDWESAALEAGFAEKDGQWLDGKDWPYATAQDICEGFGIEPHQREVYEHWIVSDWLADQLAAHGEKVDKDFAGLTIWARTTTGQAVYADGVIEQIAAKLHTRAEV